VEDLEGAGEVGAVVEEHGFHEGGVGGDHAAYVAGFEVEFVAEVEEL